MAVDKRVWGVYVFSVGMALVPPRTTEGESYADYHVYRSYFELHRRRNRGDGEDMHNDMHWLRQHKDLHDDLLLIDLVKAQRCLLPLGPLGHSTKARIMDPKAASGAEKAHELLEQACCDEGDTEIGHKLGLLADELKKLLTPAIPERPVIAIIKGGVYTRTLKNGAKRRVKVPFDQRTNHPVAVRTLDKQGRWNAAHTYVDARSLSSDE
jgi:hypothetical protein